MPCPTCGVPFLKGEQRKDAYVCDSCHDKIVAYFKAHWPSPDTFSFRARDVHILTMLMRYERALKRIVDLLTFPPDTTTVGVYQRAEEARYTASTSLDSP